MSDLTLYTITDNLPALLETLDMVPEGTPERQEIEAEIQEYLNALPSKVDQVSHVLATFERMQESIDAEIERLRGLKRTAAGREASLKQYLVNAMLNLPEPKRGCRKVTGETNELQLRRTPGAVVIEDESKVPTAYKDATIKMSAQDWGTVKMICAAYLGDTEVEVKSEEFSVRKTDIKKDLQAGGVIPGADLKFGWTVSRK